MRATGLDRDIDGGMEGGMNSEINGPLEGAIPIDGDPTRIKLLPTLSTPGLETLLASLDPRLDGFGEGPSCLDDALAYLNRLASSTGEADHAETATMLKWIEIWRGAGGNRQTLRLMAQALLEERLDQGKGIEPRKSEGSSSFSPGHGRL